jgi:hypothetical protein
MTDGDDLNQNNDDEFETLGYIQFHNETDNYPTVTLSRVYIE